MSVVAHDQDFFLWTRQQAEALRRVAETRPNVEVDWSNVIEEIEDLGWEQSHAIGSHLRVALLHLLILSLSRDENPRNHWREEILEQRVRLDARLSDSPSLRPRLPDLLIKAYRHARKQAAFKLGVSVYHLPEDCPFRLDQVLDDAWFPQTPSDAH
jgi:hypothetical protein